MKQASLAAAALKTLFSPNQLSTAGLKSASQTCFRVPLTHTLTSTAPTLYAAQNAVDVGRSTPFLMCQHIDAELFLPALDEVDVGKHPILLELPCKLGGDCSIRM